MKQLEDLFDDRVQVIALEEVTRSINQLARSRSSVQASAQRIEDMARNIAEQGRSRAHRANRSALAEEAKKIHDIDKSLGFLQARRAEILQRIEDPHGRTPAGPVNDAVDPVTLRPTSLDEAEGTFRVTYFDGSEALVRQSEVVVRGPGLVPEFQLLSAHPNGKPAMGIVMNKYEFPGNERGVFIESSGEYEKWMREMFGKANYGADDGGTSRFWVTGSGDNAEIQLQITASYEHMTPISDWRYQLTWGAQDSVEEGRFLRGQRHEGRGEYDSRTERELLGLAADKSEIHAPVERRTMSHMRTSGGSDPGGMTRTFRRGGKDVYSSDPNLGVGDFNRRSYMQEEPRPSSFVDILSMEMKYADSDAVAAISNDFYDQHFSPVEDWIVTGRGEDFLTGDEILESSMSLRKMPARTEVFLEEGWGYGRSAQTAQVGDAGMQESFMLPREAFFGKTVYGNEGFIPAVWHAGALGSYFTRARNSAKSLVAAGIDPKTPVSIKVGVDGFDFIPHQKPITTLGELAEIDTPLVGPNRMNKEASLRGVKVFPHNGLGAKVIHRNGRIVKFNETEEALDYILGLEHRMPTKDLAENIDVLTNSGGASIHGDPIKDAYRFRQPVETERVIKEVRAGAFPAVEAITGNVAAFRNTFNIATGDTAAMAKKGVSEAEINRVMNSPRHEFNGGAYSDVQVLEMDPKAGPHLEDHMTRVVVYNRPVMERVLADPERQVLFQHLGIDASEGIEGVLKQLDDLPHGMDVLMPDPESAAMYTFARMKGMPGWYRKPGREMVDDAFGGKKVKFSDEEKARWNKKGMWKACSR